MYKNLKREYKSIGAEDTVQKIKETLDNIGIHSWPVNKLNPYNGVNSLSIYVDELGTTSHGKGSSEAYALASGYAEFMERIQNDTQKFLGVGNIKSLEEVEKKFGFMFYPDEKSITKEEFEDVIEDMIVTNFKEKHPDLKKNFETAVSFYKNRITPNSPGSKALPFYDTLRKKTVYIPIQFVYSMVGTNGMCAGNVREEALCQGIFEIIERYAARKIYFERLTPPNVPQEYLEKYSDQMNIINEICKKENIEVVIKDFSCNMGLPAVGIILMDRETNKYHVHCAGETSFSVALHRCITETYQSLDDARTRIKHIIPEEEYEYMLRNDENSKFLRVKNWIDWEKFGGGAFPKSVLGNTESYAFDEKVFNTQKDYDDELNHLIHLFKDLGFNVYIRDNTFLGFPSYIVYIPIVSHDTDNFLDALTYYSRQKFLDISSILNNGQERDLKKLLNELQLQPMDESLMWHYYYMKIKMIKSHYRIEYNNQFVLSMLYVYFNDYEKALNHLEDVYNKYKKKLHKCSRT